MEIDLLNLDKGFLVIGEVRRKASHCHKMGKEQSEGIYYVWHICLCLELGLFYGVGSEYFLALWKSELQLQLMPERGC